MLDSNGNIWFWGNKLSAGIKDEDSEDQKIPKILLSYFEEGPFIYISTNHTKNLAITANGYLISFGNQDPNEGLKRDSDVVEEKFNTSHSGCRWKLIKPMSSVITAIYVQCGYTHNITITDKGYPYAWGNNINSRCGINSGINDIQNISDDESDDAKLDTESAFVELPQSIPFLRKMFKKNTRHHKQLLQNNANANLLKENEDDFEKKSDDSDNEIKMKNMSEQELLEERKLALSDEILKNRDLSLKVKCQSVIQLINESSNSVQK